VRTTRRRFFQGASALALAGASGVLPVGIVAGAAETESGAAALLPRALLFGNPTRAAPQISPDGRHINFIAPLDGVLNVWVAPVDDLGAARPITRDRNRGIHFAGWVRTSTHLWYTQDLNGDENFHLFSVPADGGDPRDLTAFDKVRAAVMATSRAFPHEALVGLNHRDARWHDVYRIDLISGEQHNGYAGFVADDQLRLRLALRTTPDGGFDLLRPDDQDDWKLLFHVDKDDALTTQTRGFGPADGTVVYMTDSRNRNTAAAIALDLTSGVATVIGEHAKADVTGLMINPLSHQVEAYRADHLVPEWVTLAPAVEADFRRLKALDPGDFAVSSRTADDRRWIVAFAGDTQPASYYLYDRDAGRATFLFTSRPDLDRRSLARMHPLIIRSRDGLDLVSYLTLPPNVAAGADLRPAAPLPMVLLVHGGPWGRDVFGYNPYHQLLANRGYAVLGVNFRGSTGFGKAFINAADREWGGRMHDDLIDAVDWAVAQGIADKGRIAIMGGSYGGYAALAGLAFTPDVFACGIDIVGPSNLETLLASFPPYWQAMAAMLTKRVGDPRTEEGRELLRARSPLHFSDRIKRPLLIAQGANDVRVTRAESDEIVAAMKRNGQPVTYLLYPDEGHGFVRPENQLSFMAVAEAFLAKHLGGRHQGFDGDLDAGSMTLVEGEAGIEGLAAAKRAGAKVQ
jgi:dipeptidyl aminopeptidase/acylaminoacyl peptidase